MSLGGGGDEGTTSVTELSRLSYLGPVLVTHEGGLTLLLCLPLLDTAPVVSKVTESHEGLLCAGNLASLKSADAEYDALPLLMAKLLALGCECLCLNIPNLQRVSFHQNRSLLLKLVSK